MNDSERADVPTRKIRHVLANCECRHAQTGFEALRELDSLAAALRAGDSREEWLTAQLDKQTANAGKLLAALRAAGEDRREVEVRARDAYEMAKGWRCECFELGGGFVNKCRRCLLLDDLAVIRSRSAALAAASTEEGANGG